MIALADLKSLRLIELYGRLQQPAEGPRGSALIKIRFQSQELDDVSSNGLVVLKVRSRVQALDPDGEKLFKLGVAFTMQVNPEQFEDHPDVIKVLWPILYAELSVQGARLGIRSMGLPMELQDEHFSPRVPEDDAESA